MTHDIELKEIVKYFYECGMLKRVKRSGWWNEGISNPESVAEHSYRTAIIALILAKMEGLNDQEARTICCAAVFHDLHEARLLDLNKITARYVKITKELAEKVESDQIEALPSVVKKTISRIFSLTEKESIILKDADYLECAITAKEYADAGSKGTIKWINSIKNRLKTKSALMILENLPDLDANSWCIDLKKFD